MVGNLIETHPTKKGLRERGNKYMTFFSFLFFGVEKSERRSLLPHVKKLHGVPRKGRTPFETRHFQNVDLFENRLFFDSLSMLIVSLLLLPRIVQPR